MTEEAIKIVVNFKDMYRGKVFKINAYECVLKEDIYTCMYEITTSTTSIKTYFHHLNEFIQ